MRGRIIKDWSKVDFSNRGHHRLVIGAFQHFMTAPEKAPDLRAAMQHFATKGDFPAEVLSVLEKYHAIPSYDTAYEQLFDIRDFTGTKESGFEILDVSSGLTFAEVKVGEKAKVYKFGGTKATVSFARYGAALGWDRTMFEDGKYWLAEDNAIEFRNKFYSTKAQSHYDLIDAVSSAQNLAWQAASPSGLASTDARYTMSRDVNTINKACETILTDLKDSGFGVTPNSQFYVLAPIQLMGRIKQALSWSDLTQGGTRALMYNVSPLFSMMLSSSTSYYVILPKVKMKGGNRQDLTLLADVDILAYADTVAGWGRWGAGIGDINQVQRCATS